MRIHQPIFQRIGFGAVQMTFNKTSCEHLGKPLTRMVNSSFLEGIFPNIQFFQFNSKSLFYKVYKYIITVLI